MQLDTQLSLPPELGGTRCRVEVYATGGDRCPVVILTELDDNPGLPLTATVAELAQAVRGMLPDGREPLWIESWRGRALAALVRGRRDLTTYMTVDPCDPDRARRPVHPAFVVAVRCGRL